MKKLILYFRAILIFFLISFNCYSGEYYGVINVNDTIQPVSAEFIVKSLEKINKDKENYFLAVIVLNTPGGLLASTEDITSSIMKSEVPVAVYVFPEGGKAASAGFFILLSSDFPSMAPATNTGAAHPVSAIPILTQQQGEQNEGKDPSKDKALEYAAATIRSIAEKRGRPVELAEKAVRESKAYTAEECIKNGLIDFISPSVDNLVRQIAEKKLDKSPTDIVEKRYDYSLREKFLSILASPQVVYLLFLAGVIGIFIEIKSPGVFFPGLFGALCLILFFYATKTIPVNFAGVLFIFLALILFTLEFKVVSYGFLSIGGIVAMIIGSAILINSDLPGMSISFTQIIMGSLIFSLLLIFLLRLVVKAQLTDHDSGMESYVGRPATAAVDFEKEGKIFFNGEYWNAESLTPVRKNDKLEIIEIIDSMTLKVRRKED